MHVVSLLVRLGLNSAAGPRQRRVCCDAILDKLHGNFNVSVAEVGGAGPPNELVIAAVCVARTKAQARETLGHVAEALAAHPDATPLASPVYHGHS